jgi:diguanylate cyclase
VDIDKNRHEVEQWKKKYFDQLEEFEGEQKQWHEAEDLLRITVSRLTLAADGLDDGLDRQLRDLRNAVRDRAGTTQLRSRVDDMSKTLLTLDKQHKHIEMSSEETAPVADSAPGSGLMQRLFGTQDKTRGNETAQSAAKADKGSFTQQAQHSTDAVREILIHLLESLSLPNEFVEKLDAIREQIKKIREGQSWGRIVEQIAELIHTIRINTQKEKQGIEDFLLQLTERLQEVDLRLRGSGQYYDESLQAGEQLDSAVKEEISGIENSVRDASDMGQLKQVVQTHIESVLLQMEKHRQLEQHRHQQSKAQIAKMSERLHDMEKESEVLRSRVQEERNQAMTDVLTGIPNRLAYEQRLEQEIARHKRFDIPLVLVVWDVDHFKNVNDSFGHRSGDKVLRTIARVLAAGIRKTDFVARYGGEEFVQLMTGSSLQECLPVAEKLRSAVESTGFHFRDQSVTITASCGLAKFHDGDSIEQCFERADNALYKAKQQGRNRCVVAQSY